MSNEYRNLTQNDFSQLEETLCAYENDPGSLIAVLQKAQELYGYLSEDLIYHVAQRMKLPPARVVGVATFYAQFSLKPVGKYTIMLCQGTACHVNGSNRILEAIKSELGIDDGDTTQDGLFTLKSVACLGCCSLSPVMMINGEAYGSLDPTKAIAILNDIKKKEGVL